ncbi:MAG: hypothetical protein ACLUD0_20395 [Eubacterium ramulus]
MYTKILDQDGNVLLDKTPKTHTVIKDSTAYLLTSAMRRCCTIRNRKTGRFRYHADCRKNRYRRNDRKLPVMRWFAGFTPYYTCVVWGGYDDYSRTGI